MFEEEKKMMDLLGLWVHMGKGLTIRITLIGIIKLQRFRSEELTKEMEEKEV